ncbi:MAG TPA: tetratricopeptide repeat protein [Candidatus Krumholzibacteria bacterium]|nr:tetratricopeptide repeat protein [Candidatus Krumholzibacteria bacterium]
MSNVGILEETRAPRGTHESNALFNRALEMVNRNRVSAARKDLEMALQICPRHPAYLSLYGLCVAVESEDYASARKICETAIRMNPNDPLTRVNLGKVFRLQGDNSAAYAEFIAAWKLDNRHPAPASELSRMGIRRPPVLRFLPRSHWANVALGRVRARALRLAARIRS